MTRDEATIAALRDPRFLTRFWAKVSRSDGCWEWKASRQPFRGGRTYGLIRRGRFLLSAHRISWTLANGQIPTGLLICHTCDNPPCVNPAHLFLGTIADNTHDMIRKGRDRQPLGEANGYSKLTDAGVRDIRRRVAAGELRYKLAREYGVSKTTITRAIDELWRHVV